MHDPDFRVQGRPVKILLGAEDGVAMSLEKDSINTEWELASIKSGIEKQQAI